ncbi:MarR family winged helix-turn-helix transcriptional regulator [Streptomyces sp. NPDC096354]|uniref:MarR family winged helix-turn-helix transcriptional regulator n=1 Tax=Streptomyces sp. NPDC096354 TaxID=3366088 RepID=UPI003803F1EA
MVHDPSFRIGFLAWQLAQGLGPRLEKAVHPLGLTLAQQNALAHAVLVPGISTAELARRSGVTPQSMGAAVNDLIQRGLLDRRPHPTNRRVMQLHATEEGRTLADRAQELVATVDADAFSVFPPEERATAVALLRRLVERLNPDALRFGPQPATPRREPGGPAAP